MERQEEQSWTRQQSGSRSSRVDVVEEVETFKLSVLGDWITIRETGEIRRVGRMEMRTSEGSSLIRWIRIEYPKRAERKGLDSAASGSLFYILTADSNLLYISPYAQCTLRPWRCVHWHSIQSPTRSYSLDISPLRKDAYCKGNRYPRTTRNRLLINTVLFRTG